MNRAPTRRPNFRFPAAWMPYRMSAYGMNTHSAGDGAGVAVDVSRPRGEVEGAAAPQLALIPDRRVEHHLGGPLLARHGGERAPGAQPPPLRQPRRGPQEQLLVDDEPSRTDEHLRPEAVALRADRGGPAQQNGDDGHRARAIRMVVPPVSECARTVETGSRLRRQPYGVSRAAATRLGPRPRARSTQNRAGFPTPPVSRAQRPAREPPGGLR